MKLGYLIDTHAGPYDGPVPAPETVAASMEAFLAEGQLCDELGFDSVHVPERHMRTECHFPSPLLLLSALAARTTRVKLATHTLVLTLYHPMHVAEQAAVIDNLSRGRMILTVAMGFHEAYWRMVGLTRRHRRDRFVEGVEILKKAFAGERFSYEGEHFRLDDVFLTPRPFRPGGPELWLGGHFEKALERAGRYGDAWCGDVFPIDPEAWWPKIDRYRSTAEAHGRSSKVVILRDAWVAPTREEALRVVGENHVREHRFYYRYGIFPASEEFPTEASITPESLARHTVVGTPDDCVEQILHYRDTFSVDELVLRFRMPLGPSFEATRDSLRLFGEEVLPRVDPPS